ncbi:hypothetical protein ATO49_07520 [Mycolicibacterium fortuitum subsp. fortuitum DSM 46621 = ATCC 6841 = JCM 6387]|nr:hypothetical protein ATO49_07520 [Mycolicibacterium fortuitum subsp. fortuitum DSM 46621 = ATCC 6841 = JCM 6387]
MLANCSYTASRSASPSADHSGVSMGPGATALTRSGASSTARARVIALIAPQMAVGSTPSPGFSAAVPLVSVTEPPAVILGANSRTACNWPTKRVPVKSVIASAVRSARPTMVRDSPAVNTRCSIWPTSSAR